jgi:transglutaminase-like putative cysteine protease
MHGLRFMFCGLTCVVLSIAGGTSSAGDVTKESAAAPQVRRFRLEYGATLTKLPAGKLVRVWLPVPPSNDYQQVSEASRSLPAKGQQAAESKYGNQILYFEARSPESGEMTFQMDWEIERKEVKKLRGGAAVRNALSEEDRKKFLAADRRVPVGAPKPLSLLKDVQLPAEKIDVARVLYDKVDDHVKYDKSKPGYGFGDVGWVCDSRFGNCTDFHSLFISLARSKGLPAFFAIGFPLPPNSKEGEIAGYHCWAFFHADSHGWVPVDISEADKDPKMKEYYFGNLTADRVTFTIGRDLDLVPKQDGEPLNFFIYPYAEVDGKPHNEMQKRFRFKDR